MTDYARFKRVAIRIERIPGFSILTLITLPMIPLWLYSTQFDRWGNAHQLLMVSLIFSATLLVFAISLVLQKIVDWKYGIRCPACGASLTISPPYTMRTGRCRKCIRKVFEIGQRDVNPPIKSPFGVARDLLRLARLGCILAVMSGAIALAVARWVPHFAEAVNSTPIRFTLFIFCAMSLWPILFFVAWICRTRMDRIERTHPIVAFDAPSTLPSIHVEEVSSWRPTFLRLFIGPDFLIGIDLQGTPPGPTSNGREWLVFLTAFGFSGAKKSLLQRQHTDERRNALDVESAEIIQISPRSFRLGIPGIISMEYDPRPIQYYDRTSGRLFVKTSKQPVRRFKILTDKDPDEIRSLLSPFLKPASTPKLKT